MLGTHQHRSNIAKKGKATGDINMFKCNTIYTVVMGPGEPAELS